MMQVLKSKDVTFVNPHEVPICQEKGIPVLDVRTVEQYDKVRIFCPPAAAYPLTLVPLLSGCPCLPDVARIGVHVYVSFEQETE